MSRDDPRGEQVVVIFLESGSDPAVDAVTQALKTRGFDPYPATAQDGDTSVVFDFRRARFLAVALRGEPTHAASGDGAVRQRAAGASPAMAGIKVLLFPGSSPPTHDPKVFPLDWDPRAEWLETLVEAVEYVNRRD